jgi:hypothetical protein
MRVSWFKRNKRLDLDDVQSLLEAVGSNLSEAIDILKLQREKEAQKAAAYEANAQQIETAAEEAHQQAIAVAKEALSKALADARREEGLGLKAIGKARAAARLLGKLT